MTLINKFPLLRQSRNKAQMQKLDFQFLVFGCFFLSPYRRKGIGKACCIINMSDDVVNVSHVVVSMFCGML